MTLLIIAALAAAVAGAAVFISTDNLSQFGGAPSGDRLARMQRSPNFDGKGFRNSVPTTLNLSAGATARMLRKWFAGTENSEPTGEIPISRLTRDSFTDLPSNGLRVTWMGHSTALIEIDGATILTDPLWKKRASPFNAGDPVRFHEPPIALADLPALDAILISHDHYDHLDKDAVTALARTGVTFYTPLGVGAHLAAWHVPENQIIEFDWWDSARILDDRITLTATPARHFSGRRTAGRNPTLWSSWVIAGPDHRVFFSGDSGPFPGFDEIGARFGPFDLTLIECGAYSPDWPDLHMTPEQALDAHRRLRGRVFIPIHWGTFKLAPLPWIEPAERLIAAAHSDTIMIPRPGELLTPSTPTQPAPWWRNLTRQPTLARSTPWSDPPGLQ